MKKNWLITIILVCCLCFTVWFIHYARQSLSNSLEQQLPDTVPAAQE